MNIISSKILSSSENSTEVDLFGSSKISIQKPQQIHQVVIIFILV